jgi:hypothetical protein
MWMKGGTHTLKHERMMQQKRADADERRRVADEEKRIASMPLEQGGGKMFTHNMGTPQQHPVVCLTIHNPKQEIVRSGGKDVQILADIIVGNPDNPDDLTLNMVCPYCWSNGTPLGECQFKILQSHRFWALDPRGAGELVIFDGQPYRSAGTVMDSTRVRCPQCDWTFRIDKNRIFEER